MPSHCGQSVSKLALPNAILLFDDDETIRCALSCLLESEGFVVAEAQDGKEALDKSNALCHDLAVVDWRLPDIDGATLIEKLKTICPKMVKVMLTGYPWEENRTNAINAGAKAFFQKPVEAQVLLSKIFKLLKKARE